jgi:hypothetical protein
MDVYCYWADSKKQIDHSILPGGDNCFQANELNRLQNEIQL